MVSFDNIENCYQRLDYELLRHGGLTLYYNEILLQNDLDWLQAEQYQIHQFSCDRWDSEDDFHKDVSRQLDFPGYYGENLDAFRDCMAYVEIPDQGGMVLVFRKVNTLSAPMDDTMWRILDILACTMYDDLLFGRRLIVLLQSDDPEIEIAPVGARGVYWNCKEWLCSDRGL